MGGISSRQDFSRLEQQVFIDVAPRSFTVVPRPLRHEGNGGVMRWFLACLLVFVLIVWLASGHWYWIWQLRPGQDELSVRAGRVCLEHYYTSGWAMPASGLQRRTGYRLAWWPSWLRAPNVWQLMVPLWMLAAPLLAGTLFAWGLGHRSLRYRRRRAGLCPSCGYDKRGLVGGVDGAPCPECGKK
jgi:hypothetical protein